MESTDVMAQRISDFFGLIYRNLIREENDSIALNSDSQSALLSVLLRNGPTRMSKIGSFLNVTKPNITFLVDKMEEQGLIRREKDNSDRRVSNIYLTEKGRTEIEHKKTVLQQRISGRLCRLSGEELEALGQAVTTASEILRKLYGVNLQIDGEEQSS
jgi:DNA-binding MarR family transcriptional regulator